jgi:dTDP-4-amino-4,6-dideoxygalactose transaminase
MLARPYYAPALHTKHTSYPTVASDLSMTEMLAERFMLLPCGYQTSEADVASICDLLAFLSAHGAAIGTRTSGASR